MPQGSLSTGTEPPWAELDPEIVEAVRLLWSSGFVPSDSGNGTKTTWMEGALPFPHVFCRLPQGAIEDHTDRAVDLDWDSLVIGRPNLIQTTYSPGEPAILMVAWT